MRALTFYTPEILSGIFDYFSTNLDIALSAIELDKGFYDQSIERPKFNRFYEENNYPQIFISPTENRVIPATMSRDDEDFYITFYIENYGSDKIKITETVQYYCDAIKMLMESEINLAEVIITLSQIDNISFVESYEQDAYLLSGAKLNIHAKVINR